MLGINRPKFTMRRLKRQRHAVSLCYTVKCKDKKTSKKAKKSLIISNVLFSWSVYTLFSIKIFNSLLRKYETNLWFN